MRLRKKRLLQVQPDRDAAKWCRETRNSSLMMQWSCSLTKIVAQMKQMAKTFWVAQHLLNQMRGLATLNIWKPQVWSSPLTSKVLIRKSSLAKGVKFIDSRLRNWKVSWIANFASWCLTTLRHATTLQWRLILNLTNFRCLLNKAKVRNWRRSPKSLAVWTFFPQLVSHRSCLKSR